MLAVVEIAGKQYKIEKDDVLLVDRQGGEEGADVLFDKVMLVGKKGKYVIGKPYIEGAEVKCVIDSHLKGDKITVFKKKRRKGYRVKNGHRQLLSKLVVKEIKA